MVTLLANWAVGRVMGRFLNLLVSSVHGGVKVESRSLEGLVQISLILFSQHLPAFHFMTDPNLINEIIAYNLSELS